jgi:hypothetical protein
MSLNQESFATNGERAIHIAVRRHVEEAGQKAPREMYALFDELNVAHFSGQLKQSSIWLSAPGCPRLYGDYSQKEAHGFESFIRIAPYVLRKKGKLFADDVLLHEMVHGFCHEVLNDGEGGYRGHGPKFATKCNEIGRALGLSEVFTRSKKNKDKPLCNHWPHCVRPDGYYGEDETKVERESKPKVVKDLRPDDGLLLETLFEAHEVISIALDGIDSVDILDRPAADGIDEVTKGLGKLQYHLGQVIQKVDRWGDKRTKYAHATGDRAAASFLVRALRGTR